MILTELNNLHYKQDHTFAMYVKIGNEQIYLGETEIDLYAFENYLELILKNVGHSETVRLSLETCHDVVCWFCDHELVVNTNNCNWKQFKEFLKDNSKKINAHNVTIRASEPKEVLIELYGEDYQAETDKKLREKEKEAFTFTTKYTC